MAKDNAHIGVQVDGAAKAKQDLRDIGKAGGDAGDRAGGAADKAAGGFSRFTTAIKGVVGGLFGLAAIERAIRGIITAMEKAIQLAVEFSDRMTAANASVAGPAAQFGVSESAVRKLLADIGSKAGVPPEQIGKLGDLLTAANSAGLIGGLTEKEAGKAAGIAAADRQTIAQLATFMQRTGTQGVTGDLVKLVAAVRGGTPGLTTTGALGMIETSFKASQLADWSDYMSGATRGTLGMMSMGIAPAVALSEYAAQAKYAASGAGAGETVRRVVSRFALSDDPKIVAAIDARFGPGTYWRMKQQQPTALMEAILTMLTEPQGEQRAELYERVGVSPEMVEPLGKIGAARREFGRILQRVYGAGSSETADKRWLDTPRAKVQGAEMTAYENAINAGEDPDVVVTSILTKLADSELKRWKREAPKLGWFRGIVMTDAQEREAAVRRYILREMKKRGWGGEEYADPDIDISADGSTIVPIGGSFRTESWESDTAEWREAVGRILNLQIDKRGKVNLEGTPISLNINTGPQIQGGTNILTQDRRSPAGVPDDFRVA